MGRSTNKRSTKLSISHDDNIFQRIKEVRIRDALPLFITPLIQGGKELYLCPFHDDHRPSARIYEKANKLKCFACGKSADLVEVVCQLNGLKPYESALFIAERLGIATNTGNLKPLSKEQCKAIAERQKMRQVEKVFDKAVDKAFQALCDVRIEACRIIDDAGVYGLHFSHVPDMIESYLDILLYGNDTQKLELLQSGVVERWTKLLPKSS